MATREPINQQSPLVELTQMVLSYIITKAETADFVVRSHPVLGCQIVVGDRTFRGDVNEEDRVVEQFLRWLIEKEVSMTREQYNNVELDVEEPEDIDAIAEEHAAGGMSEFGKMVERERSRMANEAEPVATVPVTGSDDKPN